MKIVIGRHADRGPDSRRATDVPMRAAWLARSFGRARWKPCMGIFIVCMRTHQGRSEQQKHARTDLPHASMLPGLLQAWPLVHGSWRVRPVVSSRNGPGRRTVVNSGADRRIPRESARFVAGAEADV